VDGPEIPHVFDNDLRHFASAARPRLLAIDPWVASSLLHKAIRRGDVDLAERAAFTLTRHRGQGIWRPLIAIAFEDVGVGFVAALIQTTAACTSAAWLLTVGGDELAFRIVVRLLAEAPKDRSPDLLICAAHDHPTLERDRREVGAMSLDQRIQLVADTTSPLPMRAIAAWYASGVEWGKERRIGRGDLPGLMGAFRDLGVPADLVSATHVAAMRTREPIVVMTPLIWLASEKAGGRHVLDCPIAPVTMIGEAPMTIAPSDSNQAQIYNQKSIYCLGSQPSCATARGAGHRSWRPRPMLNSQAGRL
jgi:hypothetical protein